MDRCKRKIPAFITALVLLVLCAFPAAAAPPERPEPLGFVHDYADVLSAETKSEIAVTGAALQSNVGPMMTLVTVNFIDGMNIDDYALELFNDWGIDDLGGGEGVLILMAIGEQDYYALQSIGLEDSFTTGDMQRILNEVMEDEFDAENYDTAAKNTYEAFSQKLGLISTAGADSALPDGAASQSLVDERYIYDPAGVLDDSAVRYVRNLAESTQEQIGASVAVAAVQSTGGVSIDSFAYDLFIDRGLDGNSILFLMAIGDDDYFIKTGEYVDRMITDKELDRIIRQNTEPAFARGDYSAAARDTASNLSNLLSRKMGAPGSVQQTSTAPGFFSTLFSILLLVALILLLVKLPRRRYYRRYYGVPFNPFAPRYVRRYGPGGYWGHYGGPRPGFHHMPPPHRGGFGRGGYGGHGGGFGGQSSGGNYQAGGGPSSSGGRGRSNAGGKSSSSGNKSSGGSFFGGGSSSSGGSSGSGSRGGGAGRSGGSSFGGGRSSGSSFGGGRSGGSSFGGGGSRGGGGGGGSRGGGAGRGR